MPPRFSAVIPSYNRWSLTKDAVESALKQTYPCHEIIVVDDGSTDGTAERLHAEYGDRIIVVTKENGGVSTARNKGVSAATGDYIAYMDSDDLWSTDKLAVVAEAIATAASSPSFIFSDFRRFELKSGTFYSLTNSQLFPRIFNRFRHHSDDIYVAEGISALQCVIEDYPFFPSTFVLHRALHDDYRWDPAVLYSEDFNFVSKIADRYPMVYINRPLVTVRMHSSNKSGNWQAKLRSHLRTLRTAELRSAGDRAKQRSIRRALGRKNISAARQFFRHHDYSAAVYHAIQALRYPSYFFDAGRDFIKGNSLRPRPNSGDAARQI